MLTDSSAASRDSYRLEENDMALKNGQFIKGEKKINRDMLVKTAVKKRSYHAISRL